MINDRIRAELVRQQREEIEKRREVMQNVARRRIYFGFFDGYKQGQQDLIRCALVGARDPEDPPTAGLAEETVGEYVCWCLAHNLAVGGALELAAVAKRADQDELRAEVERLRGLLREACDLLPLVEAGRLTKGVH